MIGPKYENRPYKRRSIGDQSRLQVNQSRAGVFERDGYQCVAARIGGCGGGLTVQHRVNRQMGSSAQFDGEGFLLTMCARHNSLDQADARFHQTCLRNGWSVDREHVRIERDTGKPVHEISEIPALYPDGSWRRNYNTKHFAQSVDADGSAQMVRLGIRKEETNGDPELGASRRNVGDKPQSARNSR